MIIPNIWENKKRQPNHQPEIDVATWFGWFFNRCWRSFHLWSTRLIAVDCLGRSWGILSTNRGSHLWLAKLTEAIFRIPTFGWFSIHQGWNQSPFTTTETSAFQRWLDPILDGNSSFWVSSSPRNHETTGQLDKSWGLSTQKSWEGEPHHGERVWST